MQTSLFPLKSVVKFGGSLLTGKRKSCRPMCTKRSMHLVLKANTPRLRRHLALIQVEINKASAKWGIRVYRISVASDHIHLLIKIPTRAAYRYFIQRVTGILALKLKLKWAVRPFTRVIAWGRAFIRAATYIEMNTLEALDLIEHQPRGPGSPSRRRFA